MPNDDELASSIAEKLADYRHGEIVAPDAQHVELWGGQFPKSVRSTVLSEMNTVLSNSYLSRDLAVRFLDGLLANEKLTGGDPKAFWENTSVLKIQQNGNSQAEMVALFDGLSNSKFGPLDKSKSPNSYIYIDDVIFTGNRVANDLIGWFQSEARNGAVVHIVVLAMRRSGSWWIKQRLDKFARDSGSKFEYHLWFAVEIENRKSFRNSSEIYWPVSLPESASEYSTGRYPFEARTAGGTGTPFSSEANRQILEGALLEAGMKIRSFSAQPAANLRPLGFSSFSVGFGATIVTYRNCPNNAPLALWWGDPNAAPGHPFRNWRPLTPRKTYAKPFGNFDF